MFNSLAHIIPLAINFTSITLAPCGRDAPLSLRVLSVIPVMPYLTVEFRDALHYIDSDSATNSRTDEGMPACTGRAESHVGRDVCACRGVDETYRHCGA